MFLRILVISRLRYDNCTDSFALVTRRAEEVPSSRRTSPSRFFHSTLLLFIRVRARHEIPRVGLGEADRVGDPERRDASSERTNERMDGRTDERASAYAVAVCAFRQHDFYLPYVPCRAVRPLVVAQARRARPCTYIHAHIHIYAYIHLFVRRPIRQQVRARERERDARFVLAL